MSKEKKYEEARIVRLHKKLKAERDSMIKGIIFDDGLEIGEKKFEVFYPGGLGEAKKVQLKKIWENLSEQEETKPIESEDENFLAGKSSHAETEACLLSGQNPHLDELTT